MVGIPVGKGKKMRILAERRKLLDAVATVAAVVPNKPTKEILGNLVIKAMQYGQGLIYATDLEVAIEAGVEIAEVVTAGTVLVPAAQLLAILKVIPEGMVELRELANMSMMVIESGTLRYELPLGEIDSYPDLGAPDYGWTVEVSNNELAEGVRAVSDKAATESARFSMCGVQFTPTPLGITAVATDGRRLAIKEIRGVQSGDGQGKPCIIPIKTVGVLEKMPWPTAQVSWGPNGAAVRFFTNGEQGPLWRVTVLTRLVEGRFPDYKAVLPTTEAAGSFRLQAEALGVAIRQVAMMKDPDTGKLSLAVDKCKLALTTAGAGKAHSMVEVDSVGKRQEIAVNPDYLSEAVKPIAGEASVELWGPEKPLLVTGQGGYTCLVMPLS